MIQLPDWVPSDPVDVAARSPTPPVVTAATPSSPSVLNSSVQAAALPALDVTVMVMGIGATVLAYVHALLPAAVAAVYVTPVIDDAWAAVSSEQTLTLDDAPLPASLLGVLAPALAPPAAEGCGATDVLAAADVLDPLEHPADIATNTRLAAVKLTAVNLAAVNLLLAAVNCVGNRMTSPSLGRSPVLALLKR